jgi:hypothetical protein
MAGRLQTSVLHMVACINLGRLLRELAQLPGSDEAANGAVVTAVLLLGGEAN